MAVDLRFLREAEHVRISRQSDQSFRSNPITDFGAIRSPLQGGAEGIGVR